MEPEGFSLGYLIGLNAKEYFSVVLVIGLKCFSLGFLLGNAAKYFSVVLVIGLKCFLVVLLIGQKCKSWCFSVVLLNDSSTIFLFS